MPGVWTWNAEETPTSNIRCIYCKVTRFTSGALKDCPKTADGYHSFEENEIDQRIREWHRINSPNGIRE